jgi:hypothetical protein
MSCAFLIAITLSGCSGISVNQKASDLKKNETCSHARRLADSNRDAATMDLLLVDTDAYEKYADQEEKWVLVLQANDCELDNMDLYVLGRIDQFGLRNP